MNYRQGQIYAKIAAQLCNLVAPLVVVSCKIVSGYILKIKNFSAFQYENNMIENKI